MNFIPTRKGFSGAFSGLDFVMIREISIVDKKKGRLYCEENAEN